MIGGQADEDCRVDLLGSAAGLECHTDERAVHRLPEDRLTRPWGDLRLERVACPVRPER